MLVIYANDSLRAGYYQLSLMSTVLSVSYACTKTKIIFENNRMN